MLAIIWREFRLHYTKPYWLISNFITPLFYLLFFGILFSGFVHNIDIQGKPVSYLHFFIPGLIVMQSFFVLSFTLALVNLDRRTRIIEMIHMTATSFWEYYSGRIVSIQALSLVKMALFYIFALIFLHMPFSSLPALLTVIATFIIGTMIWFNTGFTLGLIIKTEDIRDVVMQFITLPLTFLSTIYYPANNAPGILRFVIAINPLTHAANIIRPALLGLPGLDARSFLVLIGYLVMTLFVSLLFIRKWLVGRNE